MSDTPSASLPWTTLISLLAILSIPIAYTFLGSPMSKATKGRSSAEEEKIAQFCGITGATVREAKRFLDKHKRVDIAVDAYYNELTTSGRPKTESAPSSSKLSALFNKYKEADGDSISVEGTIKLCEDLGVDPEDVVLLAVAYELKSPRIGEWTKQGWIEGWKNVGCDTIATMKTALLRLRDKLGSDYSYFQKVYSYTFDFARAEGQRSLGMDAFLPHSHLILTRAVSGIETAQAFWALLLPHGLQGGALVHIRSRDEDGDDSMQGDEEGWKEEYTQWWFEFLNEKGGKGVSKDTWLMFLDFMRTIDSKFEKYDMEAAWPSTIDDFVEWAKARRSSEAA
ncbi:hypothetical protein EWM64_g3645 [Hericium alpestre]|uniref:Defective in cullin neddylation protein n=1 Tax=Hericium alpestre TaxID=135208 RepID=A0A4Y9ZZR7_9AGAM|nr:hypothetical protein EWM64_g3645 [Hericium alpestre]